VRETFGLKLFAELGFGFHRDIAIVADRAGGAEEVGLRAEHGGMRPPASTDFGAETVEFF
jgi:hypothetical protein